MKETKAESFKMLPEWALHKSTWMAWPNNRNDWPGKFASIPWVMAEIIKYLHTSENVCILVDSFSTKERAIRTLIHAGVSLDNIRFYQCLYDRCWLRDSGPIFVKKAGKNYAILWKFNAWAKYKNFRKDTTVGKYIQESTRVGEILATFRHGWIVLEGGAIDVDGNGQLIATKECLLSSIQERNPKFVREDYEKVFAEYLGVKKVIWLKAGIKGDDTHGHIDDVARFVSPGRVVAAWESRSEDENCSVLQDNFRLLEEAGLIVIKIPMPSPLYFEGQRLPASYLNFYVANKVVLVPMFNDAHDCEALKILAELFPTREVIGIHAVDLVWGLGTIHCLTQQEPF